MEQAPPPASAPVKGSYGSLISILLIVAVLVMGAFYVWNKRINEDRVQTATEEPTVSGEIQVSP